VPFEALGAEERNLLLTKFDQGRGGYFDPRYLRGIVAFRLEHWTKDQLGAVQVIDDHLPDGMTSATFGQSMDDKPVGASGSPFKQDAPVTVGRDQAGKMYLIDGYHRACDFLRVTEPISTLAVYVPCKG